MNKEFKIQCEKGIKQFLFEKDGNKNYSFEFNISEELDSKVYFFVLNERNEFCGRLLTIKNNMKYGNIYYGKECLTVYNSPSENRNFLSSMQKDVSFENSKEECFDEILFRYLFASNDFLVSNSDYKNSGNPDFAYEMLKRLKELWIDSIEKLEDIETINVKINPFKKWRYFILPKIDGEFILKINESITNDEIHKNWEKYYSKCFEQEVTDEEIEYETDCWKRSFYQNHKKSYKKRIKHLNYLKGKSNFFHYYDFLPSINDLSFTKPLFKSYPNIDSLLLTPYNHFQKLKRENVVFAKFDKGYCLLYITLRDREKLLQNEKFISIGLLLSNPISDPFYHLTIGDPIIFESIGDLDNTIFITRHQKKQSIKL
jgi:hypothetical protein